MAYSAPKQPSRHGLFVRYCFRTSALLASPHRYRALRAGLKMMKNIYFLLLSRNMLYPLSPNVATFSSVYISNLQSYNSSINVTVSRKVKSRAGQKSHSHYASDVERDIPPSCEPRIAIMCIHFPCNAYQLRDAVKPRNLIDLAEQKYTSYRNHSAKSFFA
jgi:hypothetical protein